MSELLFNDIYLIFAKETFAIYVEIVLNDKLT